jgi:gas vesicle protein
MNMSENNASQLNGILAAFSIGALAGVGLALLYAPRSGKQTREFIADKSRELKGKAEETIHEAQELIGDKKAVLFAAVKAGRDAMCEERAKQQEIANEDS